MVLSVVYRVGMVRAVVSMVVLDKVVFKIRGKSYQYVGHDTYVDAVIGKCDMNYCSMSGT